MYRDQYFGFNVRQFDENQVEEHGIEPSYIWVKMALHGVGLVSKQRWHGKYRQRRLRPPMPGMRLHLDPSKHVWFGDGRYYDLITILDEATGEIYYAQLVARRARTRLFRRCRK